MAKICTNQNLIKQNFPEESLAIPPLPGLHNENITAVVHHLNKGAGTQDTKANCSTLAGKLLRHITRPQYAVVENRVVKKC
ncbi:hypothetical protein J6590_073274 [Homalodisca vitripennis]|nr:hypothetical protein J6590_073274 [Homalodisca vitripennis]